MREHSGVVTRGARQTQSVAGLLLEAAHHCGHRAHWQHVAHLMRTCHDSRYVPLRAFHARLDFAIETLGAFGSLALELIESLVSPCVLAPARSAPRSFADSEHQCRPAKLIGPSRRTCAAPHDTMGTIAQQKGAHGRVARRARAVPQCSLRLFGYSLTSISPF